MLSKIIIIVPIYNNENYVHRCLNSIQEQTFVNFKLIIVNDGSSDNSGSICEEYAHKDNRIQVIHQENRGLSAARNTGLDWMYANSGSEWISFVDSDDWIHPRYLEVLLHAVNSKNVKVSSCSHAYTKGESIKVDETRLEAKKISAKDYYCGKVPATAAWGKLYHRECFQNIRYPVGRWHEDEFTTYKIIFHYHVLAWISQPLYAYYQNPNGIMHTMDVRKHNLDLIDSLYEQIQYFEKSCKRLQIHRLKLCMEKIRNVEENTEYFNNDDLYHVFDIKNKLIRRYSKILSIIHFLEHYNIKKFFMFLK